MMNFEAFVYCWTDHKTNKLYVGYHKGQQDDGYICSQEELKDPAKIPMMVEYRKRPQDFTRMILAEGTAEDCRALEETILASADAARSDRFYNQHNGGKNFVTLVAWNKGKQTPLEVRKLQSQKAKGRTPWNIGRTGIYTADTIKEMSNKKIGTISPMRGRHHTELSKRKISESNKGRRSWNKGNAGFMKGKVVKEDTRNKISISRIGMKFSDQHKKNLSTAHLGQISSQKNKKLKWITDGNITKMIDRNNTIPQGFYIGRAL